MAHGNVAVSPSGKGVARNVESIFSFCDCGFTSRRKAAILRGRSPPHDLAEQGLVCYTCPDFGLSPFWGRPLISIRGRCTQFTLNTYNTIGERTMPFHNTFNYALILICSTAHYAVTRIVIILDTPFGAVVVIIAVPDLTAVIKPVSSTVRTFVLLEVQVIPV